MSTEKNNGMPRITKDYLDALPVTSMFVGDKEVRVRYDNAIKTCYVLDKFGNYTGQAKSGIDLSAQFSPAQQTKAVDLNNLPPVPPKTAAEPPKQEPDKPEPVVEQKEPEEAEKQPDKPEKAAKPPKKKIKREKAPGGDNMATLGAEKDVLNAENPLLEEEKPKKKGCGGVFLGLALILVAVAAFAMLLVNQGIIRLPGATGPTEPSETTSMEQTVPDEKEETAPSETKNQPEETEPSESTDPAELTYVLKAKATMLPGHVISAEDFELEGLDSIEYHALGVSGGVYTTEELDRLEGLVVVNYVPADKYLSYDDVGSQYAPANPWGRTESRQSVVTLPVSITPETLTQWLWGNYVDMEITIQTKLTSPANSSTTEDPTAPTGIQHHTSTVESMLVDTYMVQAAAIVDVLNEDGTSLFARYQSLASIPVVFRENEMSVAYADVNQLATDIPCYVQVAVPAEQGALLDSLNRDNMTVTISNATLNTSTDLQSAAYTSLREVGQIVANNWAVSLEEE